MNGAAGPGHGCARAAEHANSDDDILALVAKLRRGALVRLSRAMGSPLTGLSVSAKRMPLPHCWRRKLRNIDATLGLIEKITNSSIEVFLKDLDFQLALLGNEFAQGDTATT